MKVFLVSEVRKSVLHTMFVKSFDKFDLLDLVKSDFLDLAKIDILDFAIFDKFSIFPLSPTSLTLLVLFSFFLSLLAWVLLVLLSADSIVYNIKISGAAILLKFQMNFLYRFTNPKNI